MTTAEMQKRLANLHSNSEPIRILIGWLDAALPDGDNAPFTNPDNRKLVFEWVE